MKRISLIAVLLIIAGLLISPIYGVPAKTKPLGRLSPWPTSNDIVPGEYIVTLSLKGKISPESLPDAANARIIEKSTRLLLRTALRSSWSADRTVQYAGLLQKNPNIQSVDLNYAVHAAGTPNDPRYSQEWHLTTINADQAWNIEAGNPSTIIAVVDTGADYNHPDLQGKLLAGYDFANHDDDPSDDQGHGTHVAGIAAAVTDNGQGVASVCRGCMILPVKALNEDGAGGHAQIANSIVWAVDRGAKIINLSLGGPYTSATLTDAIRYAWNQGVVIIAAAGNSGSTRPVYPASYERVMAIAAVDQSQTRTTWSNYGSWISLAAPGQAIWSTVPGGEYQAWSGTSMASPVVAGVAGLLASRFPDWTNAQIRASLENTATPLSEAGMGAGLVDAHAALSVVAPGPEPGDTTPTATEPPTRQPTPTPESADTQALVDLINQARSRLGLRPVSVDPRLTQAAQSHSEDMATNNFCDHAGSDGSSPYQRMLRAGYPAPLYEIVGCSYTSAQSLFDAIMASTSPGSDPSPRDRILAPEATGIGIGYAHGGGWKYMWTIDLGGEDAPVPPTFTPGPPTATPEPTPTAKPAYCLRCTDRTGPDSCAEIECPDGTLHP